MLRVFFDSGKTDVAAEFGDKSKALVEYLKANADAKAVISGFNDPTGDPAKNAELARQRAQAVAVRSAEAGHEEAQHHLPLGHEGALSAHEVALAHVGGDHHPTRAVLTVDLVRTTLHFDPSDLA